MRRLLIIVALLILVLVFGSTPPPPVQAATIVVDGTTCTLTDAILAANTGGTVGGCTGSSGADTIILDMNLVFTSADTANSLDWAGGFAALPDITTVITIEAGTGNTLQRDLALGCDNAQVDAFRLFNIFSPGNLTLHGLTLENGCIASTSDDTAGGGAIAINQGSLTLTNVTFLDNHVHGYDNTSNSAYTANGGAIYGTYVGLNMQNTSFTNNTAKCTSSENIGSARGGAVFIENGQISDIAHSQFTNNLAQGNNTSLGNAGHASGGAIYLNHVHIYSINNNSFTSNQTLGGTSVNGLGGNAEGGAMYITHNFTDIAKINTNIFDLNSSQAGNSDTEAAGFASGGAISINGSATVEVIENNQFEGNNSTGGDGNSDTGDNSIGRGGAIANEATVTTLRQNTFYQNSAQSGANIPSRSAYGGAIYNTGFIDVMANNTLYENIVMAGFPSGLAYGGGLYTDNTVISSRHNTVMENRAIGADGQLGSGGGIFIDTNGSFDSNNNMLFQNFVEDDLGNSAWRDCDSNGTFTSSGYNLTGAPTTCPPTGPGEQVYTGNIPFGTFGDNGCVTPLPDGACVETKALHSANPGRDTGSCMVSNENKDQRGFGRDGLCDIGAYEFNGINTPSNLVVTTTIDELTTNGQCSLREAITLVNGGIVPDCGFLGIAPHTINIPAGIYTMTMGSEYVITTDEEVTLLGADAETTIIEASTVAPYYPPDEGTNPGQATHEIILVTNNSIQFNLFGLTFRNGVGAINNQWLFSKISVQDCIFTNNVTPNSGGAIVGYKLDIDNTQFINNGASYGGAVYMINSNFVVGEPSVEQFSITNSQFINNQAMLDGGAIATNNITGMLDNIDIIGNSAERSGGGLVVHNPTGGGDNIVTILNTSFYQNQSQAGGAIFNVTHVVISDSLFDDNRANDGKALHMLSHTEIRNSTFQNHQTSVPTQIIKVDSGALEIYQSEFMQNNGLILWDFSSQPLWIEGSTFHSNQGGIIESYYEATVVNSTFVNNELDSGEYIIKSSDINIINSTIVANLPLTPNSTPSALFIDDPLDIILTNTIIANPAINNCAGLASDGGGNLEYPTTSCGFGGVLNDGTNDPLLQPLADNGGSTETMALGAGSPAINGTNATCPVETDGVDQRGVLRDSNCDIGAYESELVAPANDALVLFDSVTADTSLHLSVLDNPVMLNYTNTPPTNTAPEWVMGDWNGDGVKTPGIFDSGAFRYTNDIGPSTNWSNGFWLGNAPGRVAVVAGRYDSGFANDNGNDCIGWVDSNTSPVTGDLRFSLKYWCDMIQTPQSVGGTLAVQWLSAPLGDSGGFVGTHQFAYGDWDNDGLAEPGIRRGGRIVRSDTAPGEGAATYPAGSAQRWDTGDGDGPGAHGLDDGLFVAGDWNGDGVDTWGVVYDDDTFYYRDVFGWNPGPWEFASQTFTSSMASPRQVDSHHNASGGSSAPGPAFPNLLVNDEAGGEIDTSRNVEANLAVSKAGNYSVGEVGLVGDSIVWTITLSNTGSASANGVQITDNVPTELRVDDALADSRHDYRPGSNCDIQCRKYWRG